MSLAKHCYADGGSLGLLSKSPYAKPGPYITKLSPNDEKAFQAWVQANGVRFDPSPKSDYDMRGYWLDNHGQLNETEQKVDGLHFPDTYKTPYHNSFSNESRYATPDAPRWVGNTLVDKSGQVLVDENNLVNYDQNFREAGQRMRQNALGLVGR